MWAIKAIVGGLLLGCALPALAEAAAPRIDALPTPATLDLEAVARGYLESAQTTQLAPSGPQLLVFISLSMPSASLETVFAQAERAQAVLVLRGLVNGSWRETATALQPLLGRYRVALQIDPQAFDRYGISAVPSLVLRSGNAGPFVRASGDVSLDYALATMQRGAPTLAADAQHFRQRLQPTR